MHPAEGQRFLRHAFPWCTALWQLLRPVNTPVTDVIMALLRYRTTRSFCWTKTSLSPRCPVDPDTTPAGSDVTFVWAGVQLTFYVPGGGGGRWGWRVAQRAMFHLANRGGGVTMKLILYTINTQNMPHRATPWAKGHPIDLTCGHREPRCLMLFPVVAVYEHLRSMFFPGFQCAFSI